MLSTLVPHEQGKKVCKSPEIANVPKIIKSPNLFSKFSPVVAIIKSPTIQNKKLLLEDDKGNSFLSKFTGKNPISNNGNFGSKNDLQNSAGNQKLMSLTINAQSESKGKISKTLRI